MKGVPYKAEPQVPCVQCITRHVIETENAPCFTHVYSLEIRFASSSSTEIVL